MLAEKRAAKVRRKTLAERKGRYLAFPDLLLTSHGTTLVIYRESDKHVADESMLWMQRSRDRGRTWGKKCLLGKHYYRRDGYGWNCPRMSALSDGRLVIICDGRVPDLPGNNFLWWSRDEGKTWDGPHPTGIKGYGMPDRVFGISRRKLFFSAQNSKHRGDTVGQYIFFSDDDGKTWGNRRKVAYDKRFYLCEGSIAKLDGKGSLVCYLRENSGFSYPTFAVYSNDWGKSWGPLWATPMVGHRPTAGLLKSGRMLVTYRNVEVVDPDPDISEQWMQSQLKQATMAWLGRADCKGKGYSLELEMSTGGVGDFGYSGWVQYPNGEILCVYHTQPEGKNCVIRTAHFTENAFFSRQ